ncbi:MAG TPA: plastocyanin/azurin family copper-binding protein [Candidatus Limnocylindrales bacterium]|nr:plastocyanin/azurin family copper-binding protein [Candidatus Limnocylindrales bacterium]
MSRTVHAATLLAVLVLAACGGGASPSPAASGAGSTPPPSTAAASQPAGPSAAASPSALGTCAPADDGAVATVTVRIASFAYSPETVEAKVGDVVTWTNEDGAPHTATLEDGSCTTDTLTTGSSGSLVFSVAGTYSYKCAIHPARMRGFRIVVR